MVEVTDGIAMMGYAGLGATAFGSQPSQWVSNVLRGRHHPLEQMLGIVADAMKREFIPHMDGIRDTQQRRHSFIIPALLKDRHHIYTIDMVHTNGEYRFRYTRHIMGGALTPLQVTVPIGLAGSGAMPLLRRDHWQRPLLRMVKAYNRKKITGRAVAEHLAQIAYSSYLETADGTVGPDCLVVWRNAKGSPHKGGGAHDFFSHRQCVGGGSIPGITNGIDMSALVQIMMDEMAPHFEKVNAAWDRGEEPPKFDGRKKEINQRLAQLPSKPDEKLR
ncbi:hypothetical protein [Thalassovita sp.]|uniref:hypothetical protein n=1 Tax=Thalassovita sp. TaxID=1979401 RepID=UPI0029DE61A4|nr:hypothetical protein [Thalassovita sp.]